MPPLRAMFLLAGLVLAPLVMDDSDDARRPSGDLIVTPAVGSGFVPSEADSLAIRLGCGACHPGIAPPASAGRLDQYSQLDPAALFAALLDPPAGTDGAFRMPDFRLTEAEAAALALHLSTAEAGSGDGDTRRFRAVLSANPGANSAAGGALRAAFGCDGCHGAPPAPVGPPLAGLASRLRPTWVRAWLAEPQDIRPFGWRPGSGSRMPDFRLTAAEIDTLATWLELAASADQPRPQPPGERTAANTLTLMRERWGCMGCHAWHGDGGRIGPDLALAGERLQPSHIIATLHDPDRAAASGIMPRPLLQPRDLDRIAAVLATNDFSPVGIPPLSRLEHPLIDALSGSAAESLYRTHCSTCHGATGTGDGYNARYLRGAPALHADSAAMSIRPDDTLYDGIHAGGRILGGPGDMPAFGGSLPDTAITGLVRHIRALCRCEGPLWSRDGRGR